MEKEGNVLLDRLNEIGATLLAKIAAKKVPVIETRDCLAEAIDKRIERVSAFPEEREVLSKIFELNPQLSPTDLKRMRKDCDLEGVVLLEYQHGPYPNTSYIYVNKRCQNPDYLEMGRKKEPMPHPNATVLYRLGISGKLQEVFRWEENNEGS